MGAVKRFAGFGTAAVVVLGLSACGSGTPKAATPAPTVSGVGPSGSASSAAATPAASAPSGPAASSASAAAGALLLGLLQPTDFGSDMRFDDSNPYSAGGGPGDLTAQTSSTDCTTLIHAGAREAGLAVADASGGPNQASDPGISGFFERAEQYNPGAAATVLNAMIGQATGACAHYNSSLPDGTAYVGAVQATAVPGLGDKAEVFEDTLSMTNAALTFQTLTVQYGNVLISVGCSGTPDNIKAFPLDAKVKKIAGLLKLAK